MDVDPPVFTQIYKAYTEEDKRRHRDQGRCFNCSRRGHMARECPFKKTQNRPQKSKPGFKKPGKRQEQQKPRFQELRKQGKIRAITDSDDENILNTYEHDTIEKITSTINIEGRSPHLTQ